MRSRSQLIIVLVVVVIAVAVLLVIFWPRNFTDWTKTYSERSRHPYGVEVLRELIPGMVGQAKVQDMNTTLDEALPDNQETGQSYFFIGRDLYLTDSSSQALIDFIARGNTSFLISNSFPFYLMDTLHLYCSYSETAVWEYYSSQEELNFYHPNLYRESGFTFYNVYRSDTVNGLWSYFSYDPELCEETDMVPLGFMDETDVNFMKIQIGEGTLYLHSTPIAFANLPLTTKEGRAYVERALTHLPDGPLLWDTKSHLPVTPQDELRASNDPTQTPLQYILGQPSLRWAWYVLLAGVLVFLLFRAKRQQRIVPILEPNLNTSLKYIETVGSLYYQQRDHRKLALKQMHFFLVWLRRTYRIASIDPNEPPIALLSARTGIDESHFEKLFSYYRSIEAKSIIDDTYLIRFYGLIEHVYQNTNA